MCHFYRLLFPGGGVDILKSEFALAAKTFYKLAIQVNKYR